MKNGIGRIPGKTIASVVVAADCESRRHQVILVFTDGTQLALRAESLSSAAELGAGGLAEAIRAARRGGEEIEVFATECAPPIDPELGFRRTRH